MVSVRSELYNKAKMLGYKGRWTVKTVVFIDYILDCSSNLIDNENTETDTNLIKIDSSSNLLDSSSNLLDVKKIFITDILNTITSFINDISDLYNLKQVCKLTYNQELKMIREKNEIIFNDYYSLKLLNYEIGINDKELKFFNKIIIDEKELFNNNYEVLKIEMKKIKCIEIINNDMEHYDDNKNFYYTSDFCFNIDRLGKYKHKRLLNYYNNIKMFINKEILFISDSFVAKNFYDQIIYEIKLKKYCFEKSKELNANYYFRIFCGYILLFFCTDFYNSYENNIESNTKNIPFKKNIIKLGINLSLKSCTKDSPLKIDIKNELKDFLDC
jgi:hypothetical protein